MGGAGSVVRYVQNDFAVRVADLVQSTGASHGFAIPELLTVKSPLRQGRRLLHRPYGMDFGAADFFTFTVLLLTGQIAYVSNDLYVFFGCNEQTAVSGGRRSRNSTSALVARGELTGKAAEITESCAVPANCSAP